MSDIRSILLHLDNATTAAARFDVARALAQSHGASIEALYAVTPWQMRYPFAFSSEAPMAAQMAELEQEQRDKQRRSFEALRQAAGAGPGPEWRETQDDPVRAFVQYAWAADLLLLGQAAPDDETASGVAADFVPSVLIECGKPGLVLPFIHKGPLEADTVLLAWKPSPQAARAASAALPWLKRARKIHVAAWPEAADDHSDPAATIGSWLQHHGLTAVMHRDAPAGRDVAEWLLSLATDVSADLLVMGCYGHGRAREWLLGGATRTVLQSMTLPVLMAH